MGGSDAFGSEIWDFYRSGKGTEVVERDDGLIEPSSVGPGAYFEPYEKWPSVERRAILLARGRVLDVGCGAGRVGIYLQGRGHDVVGIDNSPLAVRVSRLRGLREVKLMPFERVGPSLGSFDTVVMFGNNFGLLGSRARAKRLLKRLYAMTSKRGVILGDSVNPYDTENPDHLAYHRRNRARGRMAGQVRIRIRYRTSVGRWFDYLLVSPEELAGLAEGTGWRLARVIRSDESPLYAGVLRK